MADTRATITVATYNIHRAVGRDGRRDHGRIADVIVSLGADVIALQEVETPAMSTPGAIALLQRLSTLGYESVLGSTIRGETSEYGNVLLTRLPLMRRSRLDLSYPGREPRELTEVVLGPLLLKGMSGARTRLPQLRCLATHLGLRGHERAWQLARIAQHVQECAASEESVSSDPMILMADSNEWWPFSGRLAPLRLCLSCVPLRATFPAHWPLLPLDRLWYRGALNLLSHEVVRTAVTRQASDHLPVHACFELLDSVGLE